MIVGQGIIASRWDDWSNINAMGIPCLIAISMTLIALIAAVMIGFTLLTLRRARHRGALQAKVPPLRNRKADPQTHRAPKQGGEETDHPLN